MAAFFSLPCTKLSIKYGNDEFLLFFDRERGRKALRTQKGIFQGSLDNNLTNDCSFDGICPLTQEKSLSKSQFCVKFLFLIRLGVLGASVDGCTEISGLVRTKTFLAKPYELFSTNQLTRNSTSKSISSDFSIFSSKGAAGSHWEWRKRGSLSKLDRNLSSINLRAPSHVIPAICT